MKKERKIFAGCLLIFLIVILCTTVISFLFRNNSNFVSFIGTLLGAVISGIITLVVLFITIKQGNENQETALRLQSALQVESNLLHSLEKRREVVAESVNKLDDLLFMVQNLKIENPDVISEERKNLIKIFSDYREAMNVIKLNTDIYVDTSKCDGCNDCAIKFYGELSRRKTKLCECFNKVERNCNSMVEKLQVALDTSIDAKNLLSQKEVYQKTLLSYEEQVQRYRYYNTMNPFDLEIYEKMKQYEKDYVKLQENIQAIDEQIQLALNVIGEKNKQAREEANNIQIYDKMELYNAVMMYFDAYSIYIDQNKEYVMKNGALFEKKCKKYTQD